MEFRTITENTIELISSYLKIFVGILIQPRSTFDILLEVSQHPKTLIIKKEIVEIKPVVYAAISTVVGLLVASSVSVKGAPSIAGETITQIVVTQLLVWIIYALAIHYTAKAFGGKGRISQTISGVFYVLGTLHPLLILCIYFISHFFPDFLTYDLALRRITEYGSVAREFYVNQLNLFGLSLVGLYWIISFLLTMIYMYFPLKLAHKLSNLKIVSMYILGILLLLLIPIFSLFALGIAMLFL